MGFFSKKSEDSRARRSARLNLLRLRDFGLLAGALAALGAGGFGYYHDTFFKKIGEKIAARMMAYSAAAGFRVKDILVTGRAQTSMAELLAHLTIKKDMPIFAVDIVEAQKSLAAIPWVKEVTISRRLPDTIIIGLRERTPVALWQYKRKIALIDQEGIVLASTGLSAWQQLPLVVGEGAPAHVTELVGLLKAEPVIGEAFASATWVGKRRWDFLLRNGISIRLPEQDTELALRQLAILEEQKKIFDRNIDSIDLRQPEKVVIKPAAPASEDETG